MYMIFRYMFLLSFMFVILKKWVPKATASEHLFKRQHLWQTSDLLKWKPGDWPNNLCYKSL